MQLAIKNPFFSLLFNSSRRFAFLEYGIFIASLALFTGLSLYYWGFTQDDGYVILRYAQNLIDGNGLTFNPGEHVEGYTELLWTLLVAVGLWMGFSPILMLKIPAMIFAYLSLWTLWQIGKEMIARPVLNVVPTLFLALSPSFVLWSQGGLGTMLFIFTILAHFYALLRYFSAPSLGRLSVAVLFIALAILSRPEAIIYLIASVILFALQLFNGKESWRNSFLFVAGSFAALGGLYLFRFCYYNDFYPNTYYAKVSPNLIQWVHGFLEFYREIILTNYNIVLLVLPFFLVMRRYIPLGTLWATMAVGAHTLYYLRIGTDLLALDRLYQPAFPLLYLLACEFFAWLYGELVQQPGKIILRYVFIFLTASASVFYAATLGLSTYNENSRRYVMDSLENAHGYIGRWLEEHANPGDKVAVTDVGATSYYAKKLYIIDLLGLTDHTVAHSMYNNNYNMWLNYLMYNEPDFAQRQQAFFSGMLTYFKQQDPRYMAVALGTKPEDLQRMREYEAKVPFDLDEFIISRVPFDSYHMILRDKYVAASYRVVMVRAYDPYWSYWLLLEKK